MIVAIISPFETDRQRAKSLFDDGEFIEVFVDTSVELCAQRDPKGLYAKAAKGEIPNFTGVGQDYQRPTDADLVLDGSKEIEENVALILSKLL